MASTGRAQFMMPRFTSTVKAIIVGLLSAYVAQLLLERWAGIPVSSWLALQPGSAAIWQLATYVVIEGDNPLLFLLGLLFIWWALSPFEIGFGRTRTLQLVGVATLGASIPAWLFGFVLPGPPLFGSQSLWFGGIAATTWMYRDRPMSLFGAVSMTAKQFLGLLLGLSLLMFLFSRDHTRFIADLGSIGAGIGFIRYITRPRSAPRIRKKGKGNGPSARAKGLRVIEGGGGDSERPKWLN